MTEARVNLAARLDGVGTIVRQKQTLDRVSEVLCDGLNEPARVWDDYATRLQLSYPEFADRLRAVADLIEEANL